MAEPMKEMINPKRRGDSKPPRSGVIPHAWSGLVRKSFTDSMKAAAGSRPARASHGRVPVSTGGGGAGGTVDIVASLVGSPDYRSGDRARAVTSPESTSRTS